MEILRQAKRQPAARRHRRHFMLWEIALATIVFSLVVMFLLRQLAIYQELAEKTVVEITVRNLHAGLRYRVAELLLRNRESEIPTLLQQSPMQWLERLPENYAGERAQCSAASLQQGSWCFDKTDTVLVYRPYLSHHLVLPDKQAPVLRFKVLGSSVTIANRKEMLVEDVRLTSLTSYQWF